MNSVEGMNYLTCRADEGSEIIISKSRGTYILLIDTGNNVEGTEGSSLADAIERSIAEHGWKYSGDNR